MRNRICACNCPTWLLLRHAPAVKWNPGEASEYPDRLLLAIQAVKQLDSIEDPIICACLDAARALGAAKLCEKSASLLELPRALSDGSVFFYCSLRILTL